MRIVLGDLQVRGERRQWWGASTVWAIVVVALWANAPDESESTPYAINLTGWMGTLQELPNQPEGALVRARDWKRVRITGWVAVEELPLPPPPSPLAKFGRCMTGPRPHGAIDAAWAAALDACWQWDHEPSRGDGDIDLRDYAVLVDRFGHCGKARGR
jgi:hypothetical protein